MDSNSPIADSGFVANFQPATVDSFVTDRVIFKPSAIHGTGGFARTDLSPGMRLIEYVGERITKAESLARCERNNEYIFALDDAFDLDGNVSWNPARFLNHSCEPNCEAVLEDGRIWIVSLRMIKAGEELTFNYGYDLVDYREHPCICGAVSCIGFIVAEEFFGSLLKRTRFEERPPRGVPEKHGLNHY